MLEQILILGLAKGSDAGFRIVSLSGQRPFQPGLDPGPVQAWELGVKAELHAQTTPQPAGWKLRSQRHGVRNPGHTNHPDRDPEPVNRDRVQFVHTRTACIDLPHEICPLLTRRQNLTPPKHRCGANTVQDLASAIAQDLRQGAATLVREPRTRPVPGAKQVHMRRYAPGSGELRPSPRVRLVEHLCDVGSKCRGHDNHASTALTQQRYVIRHRIHVAGILSPCFLIQFEQIHPGRRGRKSARSRTCRQSRTGDRLKLQPVHQELHHLLELSVHDPPAQGR